MFQQITIVGNVGRDATLKYTQSGIAVSDFSVAVSKVTGSGESRQEKTTWFRITAWRNLGEIAGQYVKKGAKILVTGEVAASSYVDKNGNTQVTLELTADTFKILSSKAEMEGRQSAADGDGTSERQPAHQIAPDDGDIPF